MRLTYLQAAVVAMVAYILYQGFLAVWMTELPVFVLLVELIVFICLALIVAFVLNKVGILRRIATEKIEKHELRLSYAQFALVIAITFLLFWPRWFLSIWCQTISSLGYIWGTILEGFLFSTLLMFVIIIADAIANDGKRTKKAMQVVSKALKKKG